MKRLPFFFISCLVLASCSPKTSPTASPASTTPPTALATETWTPGPPPTAIPEITPRPPGDKFEVKVWLDNPTPSQNSSVHVWGSLIKNGVYLGGMMMRATWPDKTQKSGISSCDVLVTYGSGMCTVHVKDYPPGVFVPITVTFDYWGLRYTAHTGFTPQ